jgi:DNA-binding response OmpR family regulator
MIARVLLADDEALLRKALGTLMLRAGFDVMSVDDGGPAIAAADDHTFDLVVADLNMGKVGGLAVVHHFKQRFGDRIRCIILTGELDERIEAECRHAGADVVIAKPVSPAEFRTQLAAAVRSLPGPDAA